MNTLELAQSIADLLKEEDPHEQISILEISALLLFPLCHAKLVLKPH